MLIIYMVMVMQYLNLFQQVVSNNQSLKNLTGTNILSKVLKDVFLKFWMLNIQKNYENYTMIILQLQIKQKSKERYCLSINKGLLIYATLLEYVQKIVANFFDKDRYVLHYQNLQLYLRLRLKLKICITYQNLIIHKS